MLTRATLVFLAAPLALFYAGWLHPLYSVPLVALLTISLLTTQRDDDRAAKAFPPPGQLGGTVAVAAPIAFAWMLFSGVAGAGFRNYDWLKHDAILAALIDHPWPVHLDEKTLVYYLAYYLPAAIVGKLLGWKAAQLALFAWTWLGVTLALAWYQRLAGPARPFLPVLFVFASGLDALGMLALHGRFPTSVKAIEWWSVRFAYLSNTSELFWSPQHALGGWLSTALMLAIVTRRRPTAAIGPIAAVAAAWTPFVAVGLVPFAALAAMLRRWRGVWTWQNLFAAPLLVAPLALFYASLDRRLPTSILGWRELSTYGRPLPLFFVLEAGLPLALAVLALPRTDRTSRRLAATAALSLALIPFVHIGQFNDFVLRASIPALFTTWVLVGRAVASSEGGSHWARRALVAALAIGAVTAATEFARSIQRYRLVIPRRGQVEEVRNLKPRGVARQYLGTPDSFFFRHLARDPGQAGTNGARSPQDPVPPARRPRGDRKRAPAARRRRGLRASGDAKRRTSGEKREGIGE